jgi:hypothetical protein
MGTFAFPRPTKILHEFLAFLARLDEHIPYLLCGFAAFSPDLRNVQGAAFTREIL